MSAPKILAVAQGLIDVLDQWGPDLGKDEKLEKRHAELRAEASAFPSAEVLQRLEKAYQLLREGQVPKARRRLEEARLLAANLAAKIAQGKR